MHEPIVYRIYDLLKKHVGKENAVSAKDLSGWFGISERQLRDYISEIRRSVELEKVVSSSNHGYYICTAEEAAQANERLYSQAFSLLKTANANEKKVGKNGQMKIRLGKFYKDTFEAFGK